MSSETATAREWIGLAVLALPTLLLALDVSVLYLALPELSADLEPSANQMLWIIDIYGFLIAGFLVTMGTVGDRIGRRRLLMIGAAAFGAASVTAAYSTSPEMLIGTRAILGIAGATLMPSTLALISNMFGDPRQRAIAIAAWMSTFMVGMSIGPLVGGAMLETFWWGSVFLLGVPVMVLLLVVAPLLLPEYRDPDAGRLDLTSVVLSLAAIIPVVYGIKELAKDGFQAAPVLAVAVGVLAGAAFVHRQRRIADPLVDIRLFTNRSLSAALVIVLLVMAVLAGVYLFITGYLQMVEGLTPLRAGLWLIAPSLLLVVISMASPALAQRIPPGYVVGGALAVSALGYVMLTLTAGSSLWLMMTGYMIASAGIGPIIALGTDLVVGAAPPEKAGSAASLSETATELGVALGIAVLGSIAGAVYRDQLQVPSDLPSEADAASRESLAGALEASRDVPEATREQLLDSAREAFTDGLTVIAGVAGASVLLLAVLSAVLLRHLRPTAEGEDSEVAEEVLAGT